MRYSIILALLALAVVVACSQQGPVCTKPYIANGQTCCLDKDANGACDEIAAQAQLDCSLCPPQFVTQKEQVIVYRYVCENRSIMDSSADCGKQITSNANLFKPETEQDAAYIKGFSVRPACRGAFNAAEVHLTLLQRPSTITFQVMDDPESGYRNIGSLDGKDDLYYYIGFCTDCEKLTNTQLPANTAYMLRVQLTYPERRVYTREYVIDPTPIGDFGKKTC